MQTVLALLLLPIAIALLAGIGWFSWFMLWIILSAIGQAMGAKGTDADEIVGRKVAWPWEVTSRWKNKKLRYIVAFLIYLGFGFLAGAVFTSCDSMDRVRVDWLWND